MTSKADKTNDNMDFDNPELQNALQIVKFTRRSLFLTGKAGTGKSTLLKYIATTTETSAKPYPILYHSCF